ncbi:MAG: hypothetical protein K0R27_660 [Xanthobacteraceae bacterium]|jgi:D-serine dehydratase|nr:hypothetical protein [Xanthobacteraceae bacterium]
MSAIDLSGIEGSLVDGRTKGVPPGAGPMALSAMGGQGWNVLREELPLPLAVLKRSALERNSAYMRGFLAMTGAAIAPHGKTTMSPQLFARQIADGAFAITLATVQQIRVAREYGFDRILLANQLTGAQAARYMAEEVARDPDFQFWSFVDSVAGIERLAAAVKGAGGARPLRVILEGGFPGGRTGCRTLEDAMDVMEAIIAAAPYVELAGVGGYEGLLAGKDAAARIDSFLDFLVEIALACEQRAAFAPGPILLTAGGSSFYDLVATRFKSAGLSRGFKVVIRSGCYLTHDSGTYEDRFLDLRQRMPEIDGVEARPAHALEVWAYVQSRPEAEKAILAMGKRDVSYDSRMPEPLYWHRPGRAGPPLPIPERHAVAGLNDQHCHLILPADSPLQVGDMVAFGISHPCTTFDKWQVIPVVGDDYVVVDAIRTFF